RQPHVLTHRGTSVRADGRALPAHPRGRRADVGRRHRPLTRPDGTAHARRLDGSAGRARRADLPPRRRPPVPLGRATVHAHSTIERTNRIMRHPWRGSALTGVAGIATAVAVGLSLAGCGPATAPVSAVGSGDPTPTNTVDSSIEPSAPATLPS